MLDCLRACMRLKPTRIVVGEVRGAEAHTMLKAWNTGHPGGAATVHANDALSGLIRLESLVAEATSAPQQTLIAEAVDLVVFVDQEPELKAGRKVREVALVTGYPMAGIKSNSCDRKEENYLMNGQQVQLFRASTARILRDASFGPSCARLCLRRAGERGGGGHLTVGTPDDGNRHLAHWPCGVRNRSDRHRDCRRSDAVGR